MMLTISARCKRENALLQTLSLVLGRAETVVRMVKNYFWMRQLESVTLDALEF